MPTIKTLHLFSVLVVVHMALTFWHIATAIGCGGSSTCGAANNVFDMLLSFPVFILFSALNVLGSGHIADGSALTFLIPVNSVAAVGLIWLMISSIARWLRRSRSPVT